MECDMRYADWNDEDKELDLDNWRDWIRETTTFSRILDIKFK